MKKLNTKSLVLLVCVALLLTCAVGSTVAYLVDKTDSITNTFTPAKVTTEITEDFDKKVKSSIKIHNKDESINVWVRVAIIGNWVKDGQIVAPWTGTVDCNTPDWSLESDGYYYYKSVVEPGKSTTELLKTGITAEMREDGAHLEITVIHQSIQSDGIDAENAQAAFAKAKAQ